MSNNELMITQKRNEVISNIEKTVSEYYGIDLSQNTQENAKKRQNIAMFVSKLITTQTKKDKNGNTQPAILTASADSIRECALAYVNGDFDFFRNQAYLIAYGDSIQFIVSKDGLVSGAKKILPGIELFSDIVYKGDKFEYQKIGGRTIITKHEQPIENITCNIEDIVCAYATYWKDGEQVEATIMTMKEITNALTTAHRSLTDFHKNNPKIMLGKFPLRQLAKKIINQNISAEVSKVLGDDDLEYVEATANIVHNEPVKIDFNNEKIEPITKNNKKEINTTELDKQNENENDPIFEDYSKIADSVSIFNMMDNTPVGTIKTINYDEWLPKYKPTGLYEPLKETYNKQTNTVDIRKIK